MIHLSSTFSKALIWDRSSFKFAIGVWIGLSFSIAVILSTLGIMDGFTETMRKGLRNSSGDLYFYGRNGFFSLSDEKEKKLKELGINQIAGYINTEAFLVKEKTSKGILIRGVEGESFSKLTKMDIRPKEGEAILGDELARKLNIKIGDDVVLVLAKGNKEMNNLPLIKRFKVQSIVDHGIFQKDMRFVYLNVSEVQKILGIDSKFNIYSLNIPISKENGQEKDHSKHVENFQYKIEELLGVDFVVRPYWIDHKPLLEAVEIEKVTISLIFQIIVIVAIFNVLSFITYINERKSREVFLFKALGFGPRKIRAAWLGFVLKIWGASCLLSVVFVFIFDYLLGHLSVFNLPGEVYHLDLGRLSLKLSFFNFFFVFIGALFWILLIVSFALYRMNKKTIIQGLRKEFS